MNRQAKSLKDWTSVLLSFIALFNCTVLAKYSGGSGEPNDPYQIATAEDLNDIGNHPEDFNKCFVMIADINLAQYTNDTFVTIASDWMNPFTGVFDGKKHIISSLSSDMGLFGTISGATIKDLGIVEPNIQAGYAPYAGALVCDSGGDNLISSCWTNGGVVAGDSDLGGLIGSIDGTVLNCHSTTDVVGIGFWGGVGGLIGHGGNIVNSYAKCKVSAENWVGGLVGDIDSGAIISSYADCNVSGTKECAGGLVGCNVLGSISMCYSLGCVTGDSTVGGLAGFSSGNISDSYSIAYTLGEEKVGGLVGYDYYHNISSSYFLDVAGPNNNSGIPLTDEEMKQQASFVGWDFVWETSNGPNDIWAICEDVNYPKLAWQYVVGDSDNDKDVDFVDFAPLGLKWMQTDSHIYCGGTDLTGDGLVNLEDLDAFVENWLQ